jgi:hypothetical protein
MAIIGATVDFPSGSSYQRPVADMLAVFDRAHNNGATSNPNDDPTISEIPATANLGDTISLSLTGGSGTIDGADPSIIWQGPVGKVGFIDQAGKFHITNNGQGKITAIYHGQKLTESVTIGPSQQPNLSPGNGVNIKPPPATTPSTDNVTSAATTNSN